jgi:Ca2+/H+ antiporter, TMEM165/GDT1 family
MDALLIALVTGLLAEVGARTQMTSHALAGGNTPQRAPFLLVLMLVLCTSLVVSAMAGLLVAEKMPPDGRKLMLGLAIGFAGFAQVFSKARLIEPAPWPGLPVATFRLGAAHIADGTPFLAFAIAAWTGNVALTVTGGLLAVLLLCLPSVLIPEDWHHPELFAKLRRIAAAILIIAGIWTGLSALRLI